MVALAQQSRVPGTLTEDYGVFRAGSPVFTAFKNHYSKSIRDYDSVQGQCEAQLTVTRQGFLTGRDVGDTQAPLGRSGGERVVDSPIH
jgi:hypothetical protein